MSRATREIAPTAHDEAVLLDRLRANEAGIKKRSILVTVFGGRYRAADVDEMLARMEAAGLIRRGIRRGLGRPAETWHAVEMDA